MSTFALKVSIDDSKYIVRGVSKESSKKEILCILTKYKSKDQLPELQSALCKLNGTISIVKVKKASSIEESVKNHHGLSRSSYRRKRSSKHKAKKLSNVEVCSDGVTLSNDEKQRLNLCKGTAATGGKAIENLNHRKRPLIWRSQSLSEKDRKYGKSRLRERPKSFGSFDTNKLERLNNNGEYLYIHRLCKLKTGNMVESCSIDRIVESKPKNDNSEKIDAELMAKSKKHFDFKSKRLKIQLQQNKLQNWLANLKRNSIAYFIDEFEANNNTSNQIVSFPSVESADESKESDSAVFHFNQGEEQHCTKSSECVESNEYAEAETDSGLPSLDYESSLDTLSRDDRLSLEQSCDEGKTKESQNESVFDLSSTTEKKPDKNSIKECLDRAVNENKIYDFKMLEYLNIEGECLPTERNPSKESNIEEREMIIHKRKELAMAGSDGNEITEPENGLFEQVKYTIDKISKIDENILHCELLISQLEFQLDIMSENSEAIEDVDLELEEMKMITELKETEEFLKAITKLSQYQKEAQSEIIDELQYIDARTKERQMKMQSLERRLIRQRFKCVPRHLTVSREKRLYTNEVTSLEGVNDNIYVYDNSNDAITLV